MASVGQKEHKLMARVVDFRGGEVFFEAVDADFQPRRFKQTKSKFPGSLRPQLGCCYDLTLKFMPKSLKGHPNCPHANISAALIVANSNPAKKKGLSAPIKAVVCADKGNWELFSLQNFQTIHATKQSFAGVSVTVGAWCELQIVQMPHYAVAVNPRPISPIISTRVRNGTLELLTEVAYVTTMKTVTKVLFHCFHSKELGPVADTDLILPADVSSTCCWCSRIRGKEAQRTEALWKVSALPDAVNVSNAVGKNTPSDRCVTSNCPPSKAQIHKACKCVICKKDDMVYHLFCPQLSKAPFLVHLPQAHNVGSWLACDLLLAGDGQYQLKDSVEIPRLFPSMPTHKGVLIECDIMVPMRFDAADKTVTSNFVGGIRDVHELLDTVDPGVHKATIRYDCEGGVEAAHWQLEYVGAFKKL